MKNKFLNSLKLLIPILIIIIILLFSIKSFGSDEKDEDLKSKTSQELNYLENKLISIANKVNNISFGHYVISESKIEDNLEASRARYRK